MSSSRKATSVLDLSLAVAVLVVLVIQVSAGADDEGQTGCVSHRGFWVQLEIEAGAVDDHAVTPRSLSI